jgi:hypothetical protein
MVKRRVLDQILKLDPQRDHQRIVYLDACYEFPFDFTRADEFALYRTYAVPSIANLLYRTGEFTRRTQRRYDDTKLILSELVEHGYDSDRGQRAMRQMNHHHGRFEIANSDFLYVLSTFVFEPPRWMARYARRPMVEHEKLALFYFWRAVGQRMHIRAIPEEVTEFEGFNLNYERRNFGYTEGGHLVASATRDMVLGWALPRPLRQFGAPAVHSLLDDHLLDSLGFPKPPPVLRRLVRQTLRTRSKLTGLLPERRNPSLQTARRHGSYPNGYQIERLGPPEGT